MPVPSEVCSGFSCPRRGVKVSGKAAGRLVGDKVVAVFVLGNGDVRGGEIQDDRCAGQRGIAGWRNRYPQILADLHEERKRWVRFALEKKTLPKGYLPLAEQIDHSAARCRCRSKLSVFVELAIIGQESFWNNPQDFTLTQDHGAVEKQIIDLKRHADNRDQF